MKLIRCLIYIALHLYLYCCLFVDKVQLVTVSDSSTHFTEYDAASVVSCESRDYQNVNCSWTSSEISLLQRYIEDSYRWTNVSCKDNFTSDTFERRSFCFFNPSELKIRYPNSEYKYKLSTQEDNDGIIYSITESAYPYPPTNISVRENNASSILISWLPPGEWPPIFLNEIDYEIQYITAGRSKNFTCKHNGNRCHGTGAIGHDTEYNKLLSGLDPDTIYNITITSVRVNGNRIGYIKSELSQIYSIKILQRALTTSPGTLSTATHSALTQVELHAITHTKASSQGSQKSIGLIITVCFAVPLLLGLILWLGIRNLTKDSAYDIKDLEDLRNNNMYKNLQFPRQNKEDQEKFDEIVTRRQTDTDESNDIEDTHPSQRRYSIEPTSPHLWPPNENITMVFEQSSLRVPSGDPEIMEAVSLERLSRNDDSELRIPLLVCDSSGSFSKESNLIQSQQNGDATFNLPLLSPNHNSGRKSNNLSDTSSLSSDCTSTCGSYVRHGLPFSDGNPNHTSNEMLTKAEQEKYQPTSNCSQVTDQPPGNGTRTRSHSIQEYVHMSEREADRSSDHQLDHAIGHDHNLDTSHHSESSVSPSITRSQSEVRMVEPHYVQMGADYDNEQPINSDDGVCAEADDYTPMSISSENYPPETEAVCVELEVNNVQVITPSNSANLNHELLIASDIFTRNDTNDVPHSQLPLENPQFTLDIESQSNPYIPVEKQSP